MTFAEEMLQALSDGDLDLAKKKFIWSLRKDSPEMVYSMAEELYALGLNDMAKRAYQKLLADFPDEDDLKTALADIAINDGQDGEALNYLADISPDSPAYISSLLVAADLYQTQAMFEVSEQKLLEAYRLAPDEEVIQFALAELYFNMKKYPQAAEYYLDLIKSGVINYSRVNLVQRLGMAYALAGKFEKALAYLEQIHEEDLDADTRFQLAFTQAQLGQEEEAIKNYTKLKEEKADYATTYPALAELQAKHGDYADALITVQEGLAVDEYNGLLYQLAARYATALGQPQKAEKYIQEALEQDPDNLTLVLELSNLYLTNQKDQENIDFLTTYLKNDEIDAQIYWNLGQSYARLDDYERAVENYVAAKPVLESNPDYLRDAAYFFRNAGERQLARECVNLFLQDNENDAEMIELADQLNDFY
ncbi:tetratricopeptide repeat protein [Ligilactobacillus equi]|uniref:Uncharacterized protein n=1 Tax=Ligilactobacillus equi DPC 6820 TaxID=1392007 RepID=V7I0K2_9LACO|nr:tetratricopeptide repeat protein [Ligilactobacillus equi]ETA74801.1 hypothetical protein LEQ_0198c [Ligilactobacillus equi DPC 6820]MCQ2556610.1 tetratricopeptide repeat protein [Ligilactobacillus sp.]